MTDFVEYPKMLYMSQSSYIIVPDAAEEDAARKAGYMDYADLFKVPETGTEDAVSVETHEAPAAPRRGRHPKVQS